MRTGRGITTMTRQQHPNNNNSNINIIQPRVVINTFAIKRLPKEKRANPNDGLYSWNVYSVQIDEEDKVYVKLVKECLSKAEAVANFQRLAAAEIIFGKNS
jgi:hypothetical protein